jgi:beta-phosphoglucomutase-like phosphatase (HAD superfamily)
MGAGERPRGHGIAAVIFDFDGVIADTERLHLGAFRDVFATRGWSLTEAAYFDRYLGCDDHGLVLAYAEDEGLVITREEVEDLVARKTRAFARHLSSPSVLFPGAPAAIRAIAARFPTAIASGALHREIAAMLEAADLLTLFPVIVGADDVTNCKPSPEPYLTAAARLGAAPSRCVAVEDSAAGLQAAQAAGMRTIGLTTTSPADLLAGADRIVSRLADVSPELIDELGAAASSSAV